MANTSKRYQKGEKYKYNLWHKIIRIKKKIMILLDNLKNLKKEDLVGDSELTLYQSFWVWVVETLQYGFLFTFIFNTFMGWQDWYNVPLVLALGLVRWLIFDSIRAFKET